MELLTLTARQLFLFGHSIAFAFALVAVLKEDIELLKAQTFNASRLNEIGRSITKLLILLWLTGLILILFDTGFDWDALISKPKLATKLSVVSILTVNGILLHKVVFPMLVRPAKSPRLVAFICVCVGATSTVTWLFASFVGVARLIAPAMTYTSFIGLYAGALFVGLIVAVGLVLPRFERLIRVSTAPSDRGTLEFTVKEHLNKPKNIATAL